LNSRCVARLRLPVLPLNIQQPKGVAANEGWTFDRFLTGCVGSDKQNGTGGRNCWLRALRGFAV